VGISGGITASLAGRYASALFSLAGEQGAVAAVESDLNRVHAAIGESADFAQLLHDPQVSRDQAENAVKAVAKVLDLHTLTANVLGVLAQNRRLASLPAVIRAFAAIAADARGEITADVTTAHALQPDQVAALSAKLAQREGRAVTLRTHIDPALLGGLVVQIGSQRIDASIRTRLNSLAQAVKA
jgi:F-type H+-transporting ATPase subunit delta